MSDAKHTFNPLRVAHYNADALSIEEAPIPGTVPRQIAGMRPGESCADERFLSPDERRAYADLFASAPALYAELERLVHAFNQKASIGSIDSHRRASVPAEWIESARAALAKARPEQD